MCRRMRAHTPGWRGLIASIGLVVVALIGIWSSATPALAETLGATSDRALPLPQSTPASLPTPQAEDQEVSVVRVSTDRYPRMTVRFTVQPFIGNLPSYLQTRDVVIVEGTTP